MLFNYYYNSNDLIIKSICVCKKVTMTRTEAGQRVTSPNPNLNS